MSVVVNNFVFRIFKKFVKSRVIDIKRPGGSFNGSGLVAFSGTFNCCGGGPECLAGLKLSQGNVECALEFENIDHSALNQVVFINGDGGYEYKVAA